MNEAVLVYALLRLAMNAIGFVCWAITLRRAVPLARRAPSKDARLFVLAIVYVLLVAVVLTALAALYDPFRPPNPAPFLAMIGIALPTTFSIAGVVIVWKWPWKSDGTPKVKS